MAYINGKYSNDELEVSISVLEREEYEEEEDFGEEGLKIEISIDRFIDFSIQEAKDLIKWLSETVENIEKDFDSDGKKKTQ